jgi:hypothetical protein
MGKADHVAWLEQLVARCVDTTEANQQHGRQPHAADCFALSTDPPRKLRFAESVHAGCAAYWLQVLLQVAYSLQHLHGEGIIHSDLKCENVLLATTANSPLGFVCKLGECSAADIMLMRGLMTQ